jgi:hypothetical protein
MCCRKPQCAHAVPRRRPQHTGASGLPPRPAQILDLKICDLAMGSGAFLVESCRQLAELLVEAWSVHGGRPPIPADEDVLTVARRLVAQRCLYGVDKNSTAVDLAKVSLWLMTLAKEHPFTFVDHALRHGDSLVGLSERQIAAFHWQDDAQPLQEDFATGAIRSQVEQAAELRAQIRHASEETSDATLRALWQEADQALARVRLLGDLVVAAFFAGSKPKEREGQRSHYAQAVKEGASSGPLGLASRVLAMRPPSSEPSTKSRFHTWVRQSKRKKGMRRPAPSMLQAACSVALMPKFLPNHSSIRYTAAMIGPATYQGQGWRRSSSRLISRGS